MKKPARQKPPPQQTAIASSVELAEAAILPSIYEVHMDPGRHATCPEDLPAAAQDGTGKSAARWAYERLILYIQNFESQLDARHEVALGLTGGAAGVVQIDGLGYFDPDIVTFYGTDETGAKTQLVQHVSQLNVMLTAQSVPSEETEPRRIGFRLAHGLDPNAPKARL